ncbi:MAG: VanZ family protein [Burkholderiales bacterium]|nr:VanZ family protein [Burkholderiales bacterium]
MEAARSRLALYLALGYTLLILYASLSPFTGWRDPGEDVWAFLNAPWPRYFTAFDLAFNVLAYVPLGFLVTLLALPASRPVFAALGGAGAGIAMSLCMELAQAYLPGRVSNNLDLLTNALGAAAGAALAARAGSAPFITRRLGRWRARLFLPGKTMDLGIALIALWFFTQLDPSLPLLGIVFFSNGVQAQLAGLSAGNAYRLLGPLSVGMNLVALGAMLMLIMRSKRSALAGLASLVWIAALLKLVTATALLRSEAAFLWVGGEIVWALAIGAILVVVAATLPRLHIRLFCAAALLGAIALTLIKPGEAHSFLSLRLFRWSDLQLVHYTGLAAMVADVWPYAALGYLALLWHGDRRRVA